MRLPDTHKILFGGDYNPEQWPEDTWEADMALFHEAHVDEVTLNVWSGNTSAERFYEKMGLKTKERQMEYIL